MILRSTFIAVFVVTALGCTLSPKVNVSEGVAKTAASELGTGIEGAAQKFGTEVAKAGRPYEEELLARVHDLTLSADRLVDETRTMPAAFGEAVADRLAKEESFQEALRGFSVLARSPERFASAVEKSPSVLKATLDELQAELVGEDGVLAQQRTAFFDGMKKEREAVTAAIREERANAINALDAYTTHALDEIFSQVTRLVERSLGFVIALILIVWGLPFLAGFLVGRVVKRNARSSH
jgi:hypothetical protein